MYEASSNKVLGESGIEVHEVALEEEQSSKLVEA
jgi:hypothetical protein